MTAAERAVCSCGQAWRAPTVDGRTRGHPPAARRASRLRLAWTITVPGVDRARGGRAPGELLGCANEWTRDPDGPGRVQPGSCERAECRHVGHRRTRCH